MYIDGYILIEDQLMVNHNNMFNCLMTFNDTSVVVDNDGNIMSSSW